MLKSGQPSTGRCRGGGGKKFAVKDAESFGKSADRGVLLVSSSLRPKEARNASVKYTRSLWAMMIDDMFCSVPNSLRLLLEDLINGSH
jgi:hypothetical protein